MKWIDEYAYLLEGAEGKATAENLLALAQIKQIMEDKLLHRDETIVSPGEFVEENFLDILYLLNPAQTTGVLLIVELMRRRISFILELRAKHNDDPTMLFAEVDDIKSNEKKPIRSVEQKGVLLKFTVSTKAMRTLMPGAGALSYWETENRVLNFAYILQENSRTEDTDEKHEIQHQKHNFCTPEKTHTLIDDFYYDIKDEILAFLASGEENFYDIFYTIKTNPLYHKYGKDNETELYKYWQNIYLKRLLASLVYAQLLYEEIGPRHAIDILSFLHLRTWSGRLQKLFGITLPGEIQELMKDSKNAKKIFARLKKKAKTRKI